MTRALAERLRKGLAPDNLDSAIADFEAWSRIRPGVGGVVVNILRSIERKWADYAGIPSDEHRKVTDVVVPRVLEILRRIEDDPGYQPDPDLVELQNAYDALG